MASINKDKNGRQRILFVDHGEPGQVWLGKVSDRAAGDMKSRVEGLLSAKLLNRPLEPSLAKWVAGLKPKMAKRLAKLGLIDSPEAKPVVTLGPFLEDCVATRASLKPYSLRNYKTTQRLLVAHFGADTPIVDISAGQADQWREWLTIKYSPATISREVKRARQYFRMAIRLRLLTDNPFAEVKTGGQHNRKRDFFLTRADAEKVIEACPDAQWRLIVALSRFGGLRCPSEHLGLTWADVDLPGGRLTVHSPKTEHHADGASRVIPIFPELRPYLEDCFALLPEGTQGTQHVITRYRDANQNLRTTFQKIIKRAGLTPWPKLFHNLRATRETELAEQFPLHVVCKWIGNSTTIADKHYLQVTDDHYRQAAEISAHQSAQYDTVSAKMTPCQKRPMPIIPVENGVLRYCTGVQIPPRGFEPRLPG